MNYIIGDLTNPIDTGGTKFIAHCCNNIGAWGSGVVMALSRLWGMPELLYRKLAQEDPIKLRNSLGEIQRAQVKKDIFVINIIGQEGIGPDKDGNPPIRYDALRSGLEKTQEFMEGYIKKDPSLHVPRLGAARAGGDWNKIEEIIKETIKFPVYVYTLPNEVDKYETPSTTS